MSCVVGVAEHDDLFLAPTFGKRELLFLVNLKVRIFGNFPNLILGIFNRQNMTGSDAMRPKVFSNGVIDHYCSKEDT
jgi:hypothetical protein